MNRSIVVIGLDGLDIKKAREWQPNLLLDHHGPLDLADFPFIWTHYIWPTMYTGEHPNPGRSGDASAGGDWHNPVLWQASKVAQYVVPKRIRSAIGGAIESRDIGTRNQPTRDELEDKALFNRLNSRVIDVPGWNFGDLDIAFHNAPPWRVILEADDGVERVYRALDEEIEVKRDMLLRSVSYPYDLVWVHVHALDIVQHFFSPDIQREWYQTLAGWLDSIRAELDDDHQVIVLSDHGLEDGKHRAPGCVAIEGDRMLSLPKTPAEVDGWLRYHLGESIEMTREVMTQLDELGYRDVPVME